jgi:hypothetical protein
MSDLPGGIGGVARLNVFTRGPRMFVLRASASRAKRTSDAEAIFVCSEALKASPAFGQ